MYPIWNFIKTPSKLIQNHSNNNIDDTLEKRSKFEKMKFSNNNLGEIDTVAMSFKNDLNVSTWPFFPTLISSLDDSNLETYLVNNKCDIMDKVNCFIRNVWKKFSMNESMLDTSSDNDQQLLSSSCPANFSSFNLRELNHTIKKNLIQESNTINNIFYSDSDFSDLNSDTNFLLFPFSFRYFSQFSKAFNISPMNRMYSQQRRKIIEEVLPGARDARRNSVSSSNAIHDPGFFLHYSAILADWQTGCSNQLLSNKSEMALNSKIAPQSKIIQDTPVCNDPLEVNIEKEEKVEIPMLSRPPYRGRKANGIESNNSHCWIQENYEEKKEKNNKDVQNHQKENKNEKLPSNSFASQFFMNYEDETNNIDDIDWDDDNEDSEQESDEENEDELLANLFECHGLMKLNLFSKFKYSDGNNGQDEEEQDYLTPEERERLKKANQEWNSIPMPENIVELDEIDGCALRNNGQKRQVQFFLVPQVREFTYDDDDY